MRVLLTAHSLPPDSVGGVELITSALGRDLPLCGDDVNIVTRRCARDAVEEPALLRETPGPRTTVYRLTGSTGYATRFLHNHARLDQLFAAVLAECAPDVLHCLQLLHLSPVFLEIAARHRIPIVISLQDHYFLCPLLHLRTLQGQLCEGSDAGRRCAHICFAHEGPAALARWTLRGLYFRRLLDLADRFICPSRYVADYFVGQLGLRPERVCVLPNGISPQSSRAVAVAPPSRRGHLHLVYLGAVAPHKGAHRILEALALADLPAVRLDINGTTSDCPDYVEQLRKDGAAIRDLDLRIGGPFNAADIPRLVESAHAVVVPSQVPETFALVAREALWHGVPILVSRIGALAEGVEPGSNGQVFDPFHPVELAEQLAALSRDDALYCRLRDGAARTRVMLAAEHARHMHAHYADVAAAALRCGNRKQPVLEELSALRALLGQYMFG
jgi:glycosyltransferase involved in cell wall biosynthesis